MKKVLLIISIFGFLTFSCEKENSEAKKDDIVYIEKLTNNGIRILEYGFNKTENNIIKCGQK